MILTLVLGAFLRSKFCNFCSSKNLTSFFLYKGEQSHSQNVVYWTVTKFASLLLWFVNFFHLGFFSFPGILFWIGLPLIPIACYIIIEVWNSENSISLTLAILVIDVTFLAGLLSIPIFHFNLKLYTPEFFQDRNLEIPEHYMLMISSLIFMLISVPINIMGIIEASSFQGHNLMNTGRWLNHKDLVELHSCVPVQVQETWFNFFFLFIKFVWQDYLTEACVLIETLLITLYHAILLVVVGSILRRFKYDCTKINGVEHVENMYLPIYNLLQTYRFGYFIIWVLSQLYCFQNSVD